ncbi:MAG: LamG-like jellyroll fold domain-containing protein [Sedimentisphaerales bacterium]
MKWLNDYRMRLVVVGIVAAMVLNGGRAKADFTFGEPTNLGPTVNSSSDEGSPSISADSLEIFFDSNRGGGSGGYDLWVSTRQTTRQMTEVWGTPINLGPPINTPFYDHHPSISLDGLTLYFTSDRPGGYGERDLWVTTRSATSEPWSEPVNLGPTVNSSSREAAPSISADGLELFFNSNRSGGHGDVDIWVTTRTTTSDPWAEPVNLGPGLNSSSKDGSADISADGLMLFFRSLKPGTYGLADIWFSKRATVKDDWDMPVHPGPPVNTTARESSPSVSADGSILYFHSDRAGGFGVDLWQVSIIPIVDLNSDGIIDAADMCIMVDHWGESYSLCDIGPTPLGDGIVDVQDLIVLAEHMCGYNHPIAHWTLDEREGNTAHDKVGENNAPVYGDALWQPAGGMFGGALELDGIDDCIETGFVLNPSDGPFCVFAWIKGGAPGQVVLSQIGGANWLSADPSEGKLITELIPPTTRSPSPPLVSETLITDGNWHRIGFVWDGMYRTLYVDGVLVAEDTQNTLASSNNGLFIGTGKTMEPGTYFSGLIDDVRIYNQALTPDEIATLAQ